MLENRDAVFIIIGFAAAFIVSAAVGRLLIPILRALKAGQSIREVGPKWHAGKSGTPTMGGIMFIAGVTAAVLTVGMRFMRRGDMSALVVLLFSLVFGLIGFADDFVKVVKKRNLGLTGIQKLALQVAAAVVFIVLLRRLGYLTPNLYIPFFNVTLPIPEVVYLALAAFVIVGTVNAVNLTDGVDGLAASVTVPICVFFTLLALEWAGASAGGTGSFAAALAGALLGFLIYNHNPAKVFMGDTGSLFLGGAVCGMAFASNAPLVLIPVGLIYIIETLSVMMQVSYFKLTHGKRIFKMTPLHHHFELCGWSEKKIVRVATAITVVLCVVTYIAAAGRYSV